MKKVLVNKNKKILIKSTIIYIIFTNQESYKKAFSEYNMYNWFKPILIIFSDYTFENIFWKKLLEIKSEWENCNMVGIIPYYNLNKINLPIINNIITNKKYLPNNYYHFINNNSNIFNNFNFNDLWNNIFKLFNFKESNNSNCYYFICVPTLMEKFIYWYSDIYNTKLLNNPLILENSKSNIISAAELHKIWGNYYYPIYPFLIERLNKYFFDNLSNDKSIQEQPIQEQPIQEQSIQDQPIQEQPYIHKPIQEQSIQDQPIQEQPYIHKPIQEQPEIHKPIKFYSFKYGKTIIKKETQEQTIQEQPEIHKPIKYYSLKYGKNIIKKEIPEIIKEEILSTNIIYKKPINKLYLQKINTTPINLSLKLNLFDNKVILIYSHFSKNDYVDLYNYNIINFFSNIVDTIFILSNLSKNKWNKFNNNIYILEYNYKSDFSNYYIFIMNNKNNLLKIKSMFLINDSFIIVNKIVFERKIIKEFFSDKINENYTGIIGSKEFHNHYQSYFLYIQYPIINEIIDYFTVHGLINSVNEAINKYELGLSKQFLKNEYNFFYNQNPTAFYYNDIINDYGIIKRQQLLSTYPKRLNMSSNEIINLKNKYNENIALLDFINRYVKN